MTNTQRKLAAIMFTDIVDYSAMADKNEKSALDLLRTHNTLLRDEFDKFNGIEIKNTGDGFLVKFPNSLDSVKSAISIQKSLDLYNTTKDKNEQINIRIGVHLGDVETSDGDVHGDGVNIAARIEPFAESGGICLSRQVFDQVNNKIKFDIDSLGEKKLKNISKPMHLYNISLPWKKNNYRKVGDRGVENSIAVLPFVNMSSDEENEYFCDGLTEELLNVFAKEKELKVTSRTSAFSYKGKDVSMRRVADDLGVENILEGSVRKAGNRLRITAQLIRAADDFHLWSDTYDRTLDDIFDLQDEMASTILTELLDRIVKVDSSSETGKSKNREAYNFYLEAVKLWNNRDEKSLRKAIDLLNKCLDLDSEFSLSYCMLAECYYMLDQHVPSYEVEEIYQNAKDCLKKAEGLGDTSAEYYTAMALTKGHYDYEATMDYLNTAIEQNPNYATAHHRMAIQYQFSGKKGDLEIASSTIDQARSLDPNSAIIQQCAGTIYTQLKDFKNALQIYIKIKEDHPDFKKEHIMLQMGALYSYMMDWDKCGEIVSYFENKKIEDLSDHVTTFGSYYSLTNQKPKIEKLLKDFQKVMDTKDWHHKWREAIVYGYMGDYEAAVKSAEISYKESKQKFPWVGITTSHYLLIVEDFDRALKVSMETIEALGKKNFQDWHEDLERMHKCLQAYVFIKKGDLENAYVSISEIRKFDADPEDIMYMLSFLYFTLGNTEKGFEYLDQYKEIQGISGILSNNNEIFIGPLWKSMRSSSRYIDYLKEFKLYNFWKDDPEIKKLEKGK